MRFSSKEVTKEKIECKLRQLTAEGDVRQIDDFFVYHGDEQFVNKRLKGEERAREVLPQAKRVGRFIALFPFVKFVGISGSLSKGYADDKSDFDYFIITSNNTLWICRTILHLFKKLTFLAGRQHHYCMNYFIDEHHLSLEEQNIFTRIELSTLIPVYNGGMYRKLLLQNRGNLLNIERLIDRPDCQAKEETPKNIWLKGLNLFLMRMTDAKWKKKWQKQNYPMEDYPLAFKTTPYISKNHRRNIQKLVLNQLSANQ